MISDKIRPHHLERKAILYVRQSSAHQVLHNRESSALQYAMRDRLTTLGWSEIEVIDDDLGRSAAGGVQRIASSARIVSCAGDTGVGYERLIVTAEVVGYIDTLKFIPIIRNNASPPKVPHFLGRRVYIDFSDDARYPAKLDELGVRRRECDLIPARRHAPWSEILHSIRVPGGGPAHAL